MNARHIIQWIESSTAQMEKMNTVFYPFWLGRYRCVGEGLAMVQLRLVVSKVLERFKIKLAYTWGIDKVSLCDHIIWSMFGKLTVGNLL